MRHVRILGLLVLALAGCRSRPPHTPLTGASAAGDLAQVRSLLAHDTDPDAAGGAGWAPLHWAARGGHVAVIEALLQAGAQVDRPDEGHSGWTALQHALHKGRTGAARALLAAGADPNARSRGAVTPLMMAAGYGNTDAVRELLTRGADPRAETGGATALWAAAGGGAIADITDGPPLGTCFPETVRVLRAAAPDVRLPRGLETRVLTWLARSGECAEILRGLKG